MYFNLCLGYMNNRYYSVPYIKKSFPRGGNVGFHDIYNKTNLSKN